MDSSPSLPPNSDPAFLDDWETPPTSSFPSISNSDDLEAFHLVRKEVTARKTKDGEVIQHRAWKLEEVFRSDPDYITQSPIRSSTLLPLPCPPSSSNVNMPSASSPMLYPQSSSPPMAKRPRPTTIAELRKPKTMGGFVMDDDSDEEDGLASLEPLLKKRMLEIGKSTSPDPQDGRTLRDSGIGLEESNGNTGNVDEPEVFNPFSDTPTESEILNELELPSLPSFLNGSTTKSFLSEMITCDGKKTWIKPRRKAAVVPFEELVAARSTTKAGRAKKSYYGIDIHQLMDDAAKETIKENTQKAKANAEEIVTSIENPINKSKPRRTLMWTEKYRARNFMELVGDDRTHRQVLKWLKAWDPIVFPKVGKAKPVVTKRPPGEVPEEKAHRKILLLTGPPGLGKTTLAHVCARQAGYEVMEINASDERSKDVVKGRIRTSVGTESVKTGSTVTSKSGHVQKIAHPLCVVVDEVDGVVGGAGGSGEGGFVKALIDLILLDQKNTAPAGTSTYARKKKKGDDFRMMRPLILICNDVYHPSLKPLRQSNLAEIIHLRKPPLDAVVGRMKTVFEKEGVSADGDAVRRLCEATWGVSAAESKKGREGTGEGDLRGIMVVGEWAAGKLKASTKSGTARLTRKWVEQNMMGDLSHDGGSARGVGRGGSKAIVNRVFLEGAGFPKAPMAAPIAGRTDEQPKTQLGVAELAKKAGMDRLRAMVDTSGEVDRIMTEIFSEYPNQPFNDDSILSKPDSAYEWLAFHDRCSNRVYTQQEYELAPYLSQPILACHHLFASPARHHFGNAHETKKWGQEEEEEPLPFTGPRADYSAFEAERANRSTIVALQSSLNPTLQRSFRSPEDIATDLLPYLVRMLTPEVKPIIVGGSGDQKGIASVRNEGERAMVKRAVDVMSSVGVVYERGKLEAEFGSRTTQWVYRMEPPLDTLVLFETAGLLSAAAPVRYGVRQVLDQEYQKNIILLHNATRQARFKAGNPDDDTIFNVPDKESKNKIDYTEKIVGAKKDFFGRAVKEAAPLQEIDGNGDLQDVKVKKGKGENKVWVSFHEGFSNAVRKPITMEELMRGL